MRCHRASRRRAIVSLATILLASSEARARQHAVPPSARLVYTRDGVGHCPDESAIKSEVLARLGYDPFSQDASRVVTATISSSSGGLRAEIELRDETASAVGSRALTSTTNDCAELAAAMVLAISVAIDPTILARPAPEAAPREREPPLSPEAPLSKPPKAEAPTSPSPPSPPSVRGVLGVLAGGSTGSTPGISFTSAIFGRVQRDRLALEIEGRAHLASTARSSAGAVEASLLLAVLAPCYQVKPPSLPQLSSTLCVAIALGALRGEGSGVSVPRRESSLHAAAGPRVGLEWAIARSLALRIGVSAFVPLVETRLVLNTDTVWSSSPVVFDASLGALVAFP